MKKILDAILLFCFALIVMSSVMFVIAEYSPRLWVKNNEEFMDNVANREPEDPLRGDARYSAIILSFNQYEKPDTFGPRKADFNYDFEGRGLAVRTGWAKPEAGMLVLNRGDGPKLLGYDGSQSCGFEFLDGADANGDGLIDARDPVWAELKIWMDKNSNGLMDDGELLSLPEMKITSLELKRRAENKYLIDGNFIREAGAFHYDGPAGQPDQTGRLDEIFLRQYSYNVKFAQPIAVPAEIAAVVPDIHGSGLVRNLREAAVLEPSLMPLSVRLMNAADDEQRWARLDELMTAWAGTGGLEKRLQERCGDRYKVVDDGFGGPGGADLANRLNILETWGGHYIFMLPHELNPVQTIAEQVVRYNPETGEISMNYQPARQRIDIVYYQLTDEIFRQFFPKSDSRRPGTEDLFNSGQEGGPKAAQ